MAVIEGFSAGAGIASIVGREVELAVLDKACDAQARGRSVILIGDPGIGKTTLWEAGIEAAEARGFRVLAARPSGSEARLFFASLADLCARIHASEMTAVPAPQRRALEVALFRAEPAGCAMEETAIALGFVNVVRALALREPVLIAIDDVQWLDRPSSDVLRFAARRLKDAGVGFLLTRRPGRAAGPEDGLSGRLERVELAPLTLGAIRLLLLERLGLTLPRQRLRRVTEVTRGNPLFALEVGRLLLERGVPALEEDIPLPDAVEEMLGARVAGLSEPAQRLLLAVGLSDELRVDEALALGGGALEDAVEAEAVMVGRERVRASHPLLAAVARKRSSRSERRELHLALATVLGEERLRALHLALATPGRDEGLAARVDAIAAEASARGERSQAVQLAAHALRLTPASCAERGERVLALAEYLNEAGELDRLSRLLSTEFSSLAAARQRARAHLLLGEASDLELHERHLSHALAEADGDPSLRATALGRRSILLSLIRVRRIDRAESLARQALAAAELAGPEVEREVAPALAWARVLRGRGLDDVTERLARSSDDRDLYLGSIDRPAGVRLAFRGEIRAARAAFDGLLELAEQRGEARSCAVLHLHRLEVAQRAGEVAVAARLLDEWDDWTASESTERADVLRDRCRASLAALRGSPADVNRWAERVFRAAETSAEHEWDRLEALRARGIAALFDGAADRAAGALREVWEHTQREYVHDPGAFPVAGDLVEAMVENGEVVSADKVASRLRRLASGQRHPWALATAHRCEAAVRLASGFDERAEASLAQAAESYGQLGLRFDRARSLLLLGRAQRRARRRAAARASLEAAAIEFERLGCAGWEQRAREELGRVAARRPRASTELTPAERRAVELAAEGLANKEIASALYVTVNTVEVHLSRAYAKLGVHSRVQLAKRLAAPS